MQGAINAADEGQVISVPEGMYPGGIEINQSITLEGNGSVIDVTGSNVGFSIYSSNVTINGNGNTIDASNLADNLRPWVCHGLTVTGDNVTINDVVFINAPTSSDGTRGSGLFIAEVWAALEINRTCPSGITVNNCVFRDNAGNGLQTYKAAGNPEDFQDLSFNDIETYDNGGSGISISNVVGFEINGGKFFENGESGIQFHCVQRTEPGHIYMASPYARILSK